MKYSGNQRLWARVPERVFGMPLRTRFHTEPLEVTVIEIQWPRPDDNRCYRTLDNWGEQRWMDEEDLFGTESECRKAIAKAKEKSDKE